VATTAQSSTTTATTAPSTTEPPATAPPTVLSTRAPTEVEQVVELVNAARARECPGDADLAIDDRLMAAAQGHSEDMSARDYFSHVSPEGTEFGDRALAAGFEGALGENIAYGYRSAEAVMTAWLDSPGHARNILNCSATVIGVGLAEDGWYWTQVFG
jgi:uncharacterized protein YkwD